MKLTRTEAREKIMIILYQIDFYMKDNIPFDVNDVIKENLEIDNQYVRDVVNGVLEQIPVLADDTYTAENGLVVVKSNKVYAIGKIALESTDSQETVTLKVGKLLFADQDTVYKQVMIDGESITGDAVDGVYYLGVKVNGVPSDEAAENLASLITLSWL